MKLCENSYTLVLLLLSTGPKRRRESELSMPIQPFRQLLSQLGQITIETLFHLPNFLFYNFSDFFIYIKLDVTKILLLATLRSAEVELVSSSPSSLESSSKKLFIRLIFIS